MLLIAALLYSWLPTETYHKNLAILKKKFSSKSGDFFLLLFFFPSHFDGY
jgi:hypothetical protein